MSGHIFLSSVALNNFCLSLKKQKKAAPGSLQACLIISFYLACLQIKLYPFELWLTSKCYWLVNDEIFLCFLYFQVYHPEAAAAVVAEDAAVSVQCSLPACFSASDFRRPNSLLAFLTTILCWTDVFIEPFTVIPRYFPQVITFELEPHGIRVVQIILSSSYYCPFGNVEFHRCPLAELCQIPWKSLSIFFCLSQPKSLC